MIPPASPGQIVRHLPYRRWPGAVCRTAWALALTAAALGGLSSAAAQEALTPDVNLFGDEIVRKLVREQQMQFFRPANDPKDDASRKPKLEGYEHTLQFQDGTQLRGEVVALNKDELTWRRADADQVLRFPRKAIRRVILGQPSTANAQVMRFIPGLEPVPSKKAVSTATLKLPGGDWLYGEVSSSDGSNFQVKLANNTEFAVPRAAVAWMQFGATPAPAFSYSGDPLALEGWQGISSTTQMEVKDGTLKIKGADWIGHGTAPLKRFELAFELPEDGEDNTRIWLQPFGPDVNSYTTGTVELTLGRQQFSRCIYYNQMDRGTTALPKSAAEMHGPVRYRVLYDGENKKLAVARNGQLLGVWPFVKEKNKAANVGPNVERDIAITGICLQRSNGIKLNNLRVQPWDGLLTANETATGEGDCLMTGEGVTRAGRLQGIGDSTFAFSGTTLPRTPGLLLQFADEPAPLHGADASLIFGSDGELRVAALEIAEGKARCRTSFLPQVETDVSALQTVSFPAVEPGKDAMSDVLVFKNGDELPGELVSADESHPLRWKTSGGQTIGFQSQLIAGVRLGGKEGDAPKTGPATLELRNGDRVSGELISLDEKQVQLRDAVLGPITLQRDLLWTLFPDAKSPVLEGGADPQGWLGLRKRSAAANDETVFSSSESGSWIYLDGKYVHRADGGGRYTSSAVGLVIPETKLPERFEFRCEVTNASGGEPNFGFMLSGPENSSIQCTSGYGRLQIFANSRNNRVGPNFKTVAIADKLREPTSRRAMRLFVDSKEGTVDLMFDGVFITRFGQQATERVPGIGKALRLFSYSQGDGPLVFSNLWVGPWNGELPRGEAPEETTTTSLENGDVAAGTLAGLDNQKLRIETEVGPLELPLPKVQSIAFGGKPAPERAAARVRLSNGSVVSVEAFRRESGNWIVQHRMLGELHVPAAAVRELILNPEPARFPQVAADKKLAKKEPVPGAEGTKAPE